MTFLAFIELYIDSVVFISWKANQPTGFLGLYSRLASFFDFNMSVFLKTDFFLHFFSNQIYCNIKYSTI